MSDPLSLVVLISGNGSNLQAIINAIQKGQLRARMSAVISNEAAAYGLTRAKEAHLPTHVITRQDYPKREDFDARLIQIIDHYAPNLIVLAGFMQKLGKEIIQRYASKIINIHPSLLPKYPGLHTHERVLAAHDTRHGATVHFVTELVDCGPIIAQSSLEVRADDTPESLKQRVQQLEHQLYLEVLQRFALPLE